VESLAPSHARKIDKFVREYDKAAGEAVGRASHRDLRPEARDPWLPPREIVKAADSAGDTVQVLDDVRETVRGLDDREGGCSPPRRGRSAPRATAVPDDSSIPAAPVSKRQCRDSLEGTAEANAT